MTREQKIAEAVKRMEMLEIYKPTIEQFEKGVISQSIDGFMYNIDQSTENNLANKIAEFENEHNAVVYFVITSNTSFGLLYSLLFVGDNEEEWEYDRTDLADGYAFSYVINNDEPMFSEFGTIGVSNRFGGLVRTA